MNNSLARIPMPQNETILSYAPGSHEREALKATLKQMGSTVTDIPMFIGGEEVRTGKYGDCRPPHDHQRLIGRYHMGTRKHAADAVRAALKARRSWAATPFHERAAVFLRAAELLAGPYRQVLNAATMLCQSKSAYQAEIDSACELIDFWRFNPAFAEDLYSHYAVTPFNFTAIAGNLPTAPALMGNTVVWKPAASTMYSGHFILQLLRQAGLPDGVINMVSGPSSDISDVLLKHPDLAGVHFTGSTGVFNSMWKIVADGLPSLRTYPRLVGETGGKDFVVAHPSADPVAVATALVRGAFEYQGQKCSAASRAYIPDSLWPKVKKAMEDQLGRVKMGDVEDFSNFVNAVIDRRAYESITAYIKAVKPRDGAKIIFGGKFSDEKGYFIEPTVIKASRPDYKTMCEEIFGPVLTVHTYADKAWSQTLKTVDQTSPYALTGAVFADDRAALREAADVLVNAAGNLYLNDKPTGATVGQQPFGGARGSGTNDKAGSFLNLARWTSARNIKENFVPPTDFPYPFMAKP
ncbi:MAG: 1-pyrroline-5-carboxylate dehydrogenase [Elusimicrobia bacterium]|nr:MAG: 1-pyrroline-5-carboxylate dehydrogenase [Elusimicrobiota bacterium]